MKTSYSIDPAHSSVHFRIRHLMIANVRGAFRLLSGTVVFDPNNLPQSSIVVDVDANSVNTLEPKRDEHLKTKEFLDSDAFPTFHFASTRIDWAGKGEIEVTGNLTIRGISKEIILRVEGPSRESKDPWGNLRIGAHLTTTVRRKDFGLAWNAALETGGFVLGDDVHVEAEVQLIRSKAE